MPAHIVNLDALAFERWDKAYPPDQKPPAERFGADIAPVGSRLGARKLGYNVTVIDPGKAAYPAHAHRVNEEMFMVLEGTGELRLGPETHPVRAGDIIACPPGGPETAHQLSNTGTAPLKVLMVSTAETTEILHYPDSGKTAFGQRGVGPDGKPVMFRGMLRDDTPQPGYWDGE
jgi:uncharacterized cupin superfamily protein